MNSFKDCVQPKLVNTIKMYQKIEIGRGVVCIFQFTTDPYFHFIFCYNPEPEK